MPQMGVSVAEGTVVEWKKQVGDWIEADEIIASISTDKIDTDVESPATGRVAEIIVDVGETVDVGTVMARIATDARARRGAPCPRTSASRETGHGRGDRRARGARRGRRAVRRHDRRARGRAQRAARRRRRRYSPVVMRIAAEHDVDLEQIEGTGRGGRVSQEGRARVSWRAAPKEEPPMHIESPYRPDEPVAPKQRRSRACSASTRSRSAAPPGAGARAGRHRRGQPLSRMRQAIGSRMVQSLQTAATCTTIAEADMTRIEAARKAARLSYLPYQARATIETLLEFPALNATLEGDIHTVYTDAVHLGIAVILGEGGLIVPIIRDAQDLASRAWPSASRTSRGAPARTSSSRTR